MVNVISVYNGLVIRQPTLETRIEWEVFDHGTRSSSWSCRMAQEMAGIILYIYHPVDGNRIHVKMKYDYKVADAEDLISVLVRGIEEGVCGNH